MNLLDYKDIVRDLSQQLTDGEHHDAISVVRANIEPIYQAFNNDINNCLQAGDEENIYVKGLQGCFPDDLGVQRLGLTRIALDVDLDAKRRSYREQLKAYNQSSDPIFQLDPGRDQSGKVIPRLEMRSDQELIRIKPEHYDQRSHSFQYGPYRLQFDQNLPIELLRKTFGDVRLNGKHIFARLSPDRVNQNQLMLEHIYRPANPELFRKTIKTPRRGRDSSIFTAEFSRSLIERLEVKITRNSSGNLSILIEELPFSDSPFFVARTLHCDTDAVDGTDLTDVTLNHLDFAVNLYEDDSAIERKGAYLGRDPIVKATQRLHFFRIENIPFKYLIEYARIIMKSKELTEEWINNQFKS